MDVAHLVEQSTEYVLSPGYAHKQVMAKAFEICTKLAQRSDSFNATCVSCLLPGLVDKVADIKLRLGVCACLTACCEAVGLPFVVHSSLSQFSAHKNPKVRRHEF